MKDQASPLTPKQEKFCQLVSSGKGFSQSYREAYVTVGMLDKTVYEAASRLMADSKITARVDALRGEVLSKVAEEITYGYQEAMAELCEAVAFAIKRGSPAAVVAALNLKQKISGLQVEERKNQLSPIAGLSADRVAAALEALNALRLARAGAQFD